MPSPLDNTATPIPEALQERVALRWQHIGDAAPSAADQLLEHAGLGPEAGRVLAGSEWISRYLAAHPDTLSHLIEDGLSDRRPIGYFADHLAEAVGTSDDDHHVMKALRRLRNYEMLRLTWRFLAHRAQLEEVIATVSALARSSIVVAIEAATRKLETAFGRAVCPQHDPSHLVALAMGKLGGNELNLSSDIDLIFCYAGNGETSGRRTRSFQEFFTRVGQQAIKLLDSVTEDGFVFRVDMRLRPNGDSGPLVLSFDAMEHYYQTHGRDWERYALIKAEALGGTTAQRDDILSRLRPFVYRRYLDYSAFDAIRDMRRKISQELQDSKLKNDIKRGSGGIRQIEFMIQTLQLVRGGRHRELQSTSLHTAADALSRAGFLESDVRDRLLLRYTLLRNAEHYLQAVGDTQTHTLPEDPAARAQLAFMAGFEDEDAYFAAIEAAREDVSSIFDDHFAVGEDHQGSHNRDQDAAAFARFDNPDAVDTLIEGLRTGRLYRSLTSDGRNYVDRLLPLIIAQASETPTPIDTLKRWLHVVESIGRRSAYIALLIEEPAIRHRVTQLVAASSWFSRWLGRYPVLMDSLFNPPSAAQLLDQSNSLRQIEAEIGAAYDFEHAMARLREVHNGMLLHITSADIDGRLTGLQVRQALTVLAEALITAAVNVAATELEVSADTLGIIAYGRLGSQEMNYGSDLDLVFVFDQDADGALDDRQKHRLVRRVIHLISTRTEAGRLYELDMRLRPNGRKGTLITSWEGYRKYQLNDAWTWEHQALVRARLVFGAERLGEKFKLLRNECLSRVRNIDELKQQIIDMRQRMLTEHTDLGSDAVNVKTHRGAMVDVEFIVQFMVLAFAHRHPTLLDSTHTQVLLTTMGDLGLLKPEERAALSNGYALLSEIAARKALLDDVSGASRDEVATTLQAITAVFNDQLGNDDARPASGTGK